MVFLKLVHTEYQVNHKTQQFCVKVVHLVPNVQTLAGTIRHLIAKSQTNGFIDHLDPKRLSFVIYLGLRMHQFQKYHLLSA